MHVVDDGAGADNPNVQKAAPEVIIDGHRVLQPEDEDVPDQDDCVVDDQALSLEHVLEEKLGAKITICDVVIYEKPKNNFGITNLNRTNVHFCLFFQPQLSSSFI